MLLKQVLVVFISACLSYYFFGESGFDPKSLDGKNVLITGASYGIGEHLAYHYAKYGANIFITARSSVLLEQVIEECRKLGRKDRKYGLISADMMLEGNRQLVIKEAIEFYGDIDVLVLNHAKHPPVYKWEGTDEQLDTLDEILQTNTISFIHLVAAALPSLRKTSGSVAVVGSGLGRVPTPFTLEYQTSKFALDGFFSGLRYEFKVTDENVSITYCIIGLIATDNGNKAVERARQFMASPNNFLLSTFPPSHPKDAAQAILEATTMGRGEVYYPKHQFMWLVGVVRSIWPEMEIIDAIGFGK